MISSPRQDKLRDAIGKMLATGSAPIKPTNPIKKTVKIKSIKKVKSY